MKMSSACSFISMQIKVIFIRMISHLDSLWNGGTRELGNGLFSRISNDDFFPVERQINHKKPNDRRLFSDIFLVINQN